MRKKDEIIKSARVEVERGFLKKMNLFLYTITGKKKIAASENENWINSGFLKVRKHLNLIRFNEPK